MPRLTRRDALRAGALAAGAAGIAATSGCAEVVRHTVPARRTPETVALPATGDLSPTVRLLNRAAFGPAPGDVARVSKMGVAAYVDEQLNAPADDDHEDIGLRMRLATIDALHLSAYELRDYDDEEILRELQQAAILRAVYSPWQLRERMVDFWGNHFNIFARKGFGVSNKAVDDLNVIRKHALGTFPELLKASATSPAMLAYLDNQQNKRGVANENYARELMELHTLGVDGGYTQKDVQEVARCLTGWTIEDGFLKDRGAFAFDDARHDDGPKTVLGKHIPPGQGQRDGEMVLDILAEHPSTAHFISKKMVRYFYGTEDEATIRSTAAVYTQTKGDIKAMMRHLLTSPDLQSAPPAMKRPFDYVVSVLRATNADTDGGPALQGHLAKMGQPLFQWPMPDGYPDKTGAWTGSLLARWNFVSQLAKGGIRGTTVPKPDSKPTADALIEQFLGRHATDPTVANLRTALLAHANKPVEAGVLILASPVFQWR
jgi:uncharacterized protein (DUF1800 family)